MKNQERWLWAAGILLLDTAVIVIPLAALLAAYVLIARPAWFKDWIGRLYQEE